MADQAEAQKRGWLGRTFGGAFAKPSPEAKKPAPPPPADQPDPPGGA
jgi:hypothetical protein